jgi:hypothetical protein
MKKILLPLLLLVYTLSQGQHYSGIYFNGSKPLDQFKQFGQKKGTGISFEYISEPYKLKNNILIHLGLGLDIQGHGSRKFDSVLLTTDDKGKAEFSNAAVGFFIGPKIGYKFGKWEPYIELNIAWRKYTTSQTISFYQQVAGYDQQTTTQLLNNKTINLGLGAGIIKEINNNFAFDFRICYNLGSQTTVSNLDGIVRNTSGTPFSFANTKGVNGNILFYRLGLLFNLSDCCRSRGSGYSGGSHDNSPSISSPTNTTPSQTTPPPSNKKPAELKTLPPPAKPRN